MDTNKRASPDMFCDDSYEGIEGKTNDTKEKKPKCQYSPGEYKLRKELVSWTGLL